MENEAARITSMAAVLSALEEAREKRDLSKAEVARRMGRKPEAVSRLLRGAGANPTLATLVELADALEIEINLTITERPKRRRRGYSPLKVRAAV